MSVLATVAVALWAMLPAYVPNNVAVLVGGGRPIDGGSKWGNRRLLGDGKTWRGTVAGVLVGFALALALSAFQSTVADATGIAPPEFPTLAGLGLAAGAMLGDITASFLKRRTGRERGAAFPVVDQLDFVAGALLLALALAPEWFLETFTLPVLVTVVVITPILHVGTNAIAYVLGLKAEPW